MEKNKKIKVRPFKLHYACNGYAEGLILKRTLNFREANHIASQILGLSTDLAWNDFVDNKEELREQRNQLIKDISELIEGKVGYDYISDNWACGQALEDLNIAPFFSLLKYLIDKDIIK